MNRTYYTFNQFTVLGITVLTSLFHGHLTRRWSDNSEMDGAARSLVSIADNVGDWHIAENHVIEEEVAELLQCAGYIRRTYVHSHRGDRVEVAVVAGPTGPLSFHRPEICYSSDNFEIQQKPERIIVEARDGRADKLWGMTFYTRDFGAGMLRVLYGWGDGLTWQSPANPRIELRREPYLIKLQISSSLPAGTDTSLYDSAAEFAAEFLPALRQSLSGRDVDSRAPRDRKFGSQP